VSSSSDLHHGEVFAPEVGVQEVVFFAFHVVQNLREHRLHALTETPALDFEIAHGSRERLALSFVISLHLFEANDPPGIDAANERRQNCALVIDVPR
jgi:hypothetical protein